MSEQTPTRSMKSFTVRVLVVQPIFMLELGLASNRYEKRTISGYDLEDAKRRAGIQ